LYNEYYTLPMVGQDFMSNLICNNDRQRGYLTCNQQCEENN
jgi:hypothetical protein